MAVSRLTTLRDTTNGTSYSFSSITPGANDTIVMVVLARQMTSTCTVNNVSGTSLTWTLKSSQTVNGGADKIFVFWANTGGSTAASVYSLTLGATSQGVIAYICQVTATDLITADPIAQVVFNTATSTNPTTGTLGTAVNTLNECIAAWIGSLGTGADPANVSAPPSSWTEDADNGIATPTTNASLAHRNSGQSGTTAITFTAASTTWGLVFVEVYGFGQGVEGRRVTQTGIEATVTPDSAAVNALVTESGVEISVTSDNTGTNAIVTESGVEVVTQRLPVVAGVTSTGVEVAGTPTSAEAVVTQSGDEVALTPSSATALLTQSGIEVVSQREPVVAGVTMSGVEVVIAVIHTAGHQRVRSGFLGL